MGEFTRVGRNMIVGYLLAQPKGFAAMPDFCASSNRRVYGRQKFGTPPDLEPIHNSCQRRR